MDIRECFCEFLSNLWVGLHSTQYSRASASTASMESVLDTLTSRQIHMEVQDRRCISEARRHRASGSKALFRAKMLEHRRLQAQMLQMQRYRENILAQLDAVSSHEINQTFMKALRGAVGVKHDVAAVRDDMEKTMEDFQDTIHQVKDMSDFLGNPIASTIEISDEDLEHEFMDATNESMMMTEPEAPLIKAESVSPVPVVPAPTKRLLVGALG